MGQVENGEFLGADERRRVEPSDGVRRQVERAELRQTNAEVDGQANDVVATEVQVAQVGNRPELCRVQRT